MGVGSVVLVAQRALESFSRAPEDQIAPLDDEPGDLGNLGGENWSWHGSDHTE